MILWSCGEDERVEWPALGPDVLFREELPLCQTAAGRPGGIMSNCHWADAPLRGNDSRAADFQENWNYQEAFFTPGMRPAEAISRN